MDVDLILDIYNAMPVHHRGLSRDGLHIVDLGTQDMREYATLEKLNPKQLVGLAKRLGLKVANLHFNPMSMKQFA